MDPSNRATCQQLLDHPYFDKVTSSSSEVLSVTSHPAAQTGGAAGTTQETTEPEPVDALPTIKGKAAKIKVRTSV